MYSKVFINNDWELKEAYRRIEILEDNEHFMNEDEQDELVHLYNEVDRYLSDNDQAELFD